MRLIEVWELENIAEVCDNIWSIRWNNPNYEYTENVFELFFALV